MRRILVSKRFEKDIKRLLRRGVTMTPLKEAIALLAAGGTLPERYHDHPLRGEYRGFRECHLAPDWLLIYRLGETTLELARTGTHADLFA